MAAYQAAPKTKSGLFLCRETASSRKMLAYSSSVPLEVDSLFEQLKLGCPDSYDAATAAACQNAWTYFHRECREHGYTALEVQAMYKAVKDASHLEHVPLEDEAINERWERFLGMKPAAAAKAELLAAAGAWNAFLHAIRGTSFTLEERLDMFYIKRLKALGPLPDAEPVLFEPSPDDVRRVQAIKAAAATAAAAARVAARTNAKNAAKLAAKAAQTAHEAERLAKAKGVDLSARTSSWKAATKQASVEAAEAAIKAQEAAALVAAAEAEAAEQVLLVAHMNSEKNLAVAQAAIAALECPGLPSLGPLVECVRRSGSVAEAVALVSAELEAEVEVEEEEAAAAGNGTMNEGAVEGSKEGGQANTMSSRMDGEEEGLGEEAGSGLWKDTERSDFGEVESEGDGENFNSCGGKEDGEQQQEKQEETAGSDKQRPQEDKAVEEKSGMDCKEQEGDRELEGDYQDAEDGEGEYIGVGGVDGEATQQRQGLFAALEWDDKKVPLGEVKPAQWTSDMTFEAGMTGTQAQDKLSSRQVQQVVEEVAAAPPRKRSGFLCCFSSAVDV